MPVNSFENYYMSFKPVKSELKSPYAKSLAELLEKDIINGVLKPHTKLPPQRELADWLDLSLNMVTQAYAACERKGLVYGVMGKGTFVSPSSVANLADSSMHSDGVAVNMGGVITFPSFNSIIAQELKNIFHNMDYEKVLLPMTASDVSEVQNRIAEWMNSFNMPTDNRYLTIAYGAQNALAVIMSSLFEPGDIILTDGYTYPFFKQLAINMQIQLIPLKHDEYGMLPEDIEECCIKNRPKGIYLMPTCHNPLGYFMPLHRRKEIAGIIKKYNIIAIEDDASRFTVDSGIIPISAMLPKNGIYISGISNFYSGNLKLAFMAVPEVFSDKIFLGSLGMNLSVAPPIQCEMTKKLTTNASLPWLSEEKKKLAHSRNAKFNSFFGFESKNEEDISSFRWLKLPEKFNEMQGTDFELMAQNKGVIVYHSDRFAVGNIVRNEDKYIRIAVSTPATEDEYITGLSRIYDLLYK